MQKASISKKILTAKTGKAEFCGKRLEGNAGKADIYNKVVPCVKWQGLLTILIATALLLCVIGTNQAKAAEQSLSLKYTNESTGYVAAVYDELGLLTSNERAELFEQLKALTVHGHAVFVSTKDEWYSTAAYAEKRYHSEFGTQSGTIFIIDMENRVLYIFSDGDNYKIITKNKAENITDKYYKYAKKSDYYTCASKVFGDIEILLGGGSIIEPMKIVCNALLSVMVALIVCYYWARSNSKVQRSDNDELLMYAEKNFKYSTPTLRYTYTEKTYDPPSDSSSDSGGGGGGSSGGGGGHGF